MKDTSRKIDAVTARRTLSCQTKRAPVAAEAISPSGSAPARRGGGGTRRGAAGGGGGGPQRGRGGGAEEGGGVDEQPAGGPHEGEEEPADQRPDRDVEV